MAVVLMQPQVQMVVQVVEAVKAQVRAVQEIHQALHRRKEITEAVRVGLITT